MSAFSDVVASRELLWNLTLRELRTKYRRSFLGWTWSMLNPLAAVAIYGFVFGVLLQGGAPVGTTSGMENFAMFLLCALLPWNFFSLVNTLGMSAISSNSGLVRRVAFPREVLVFSNVAHALVQFSIELTLLIIVITIAGNTTALAWIPMLIVLMALLAAFASGFALALSALSVYFRDLGYLWTIVMQVWFFTTPIVYPPALIEDRLPSWAQNLMRLNPMHHVVAAFRNCLYDLSWPAATRMTAITLSAGISLISGWWIFQRLGRRLPEEV
jgi:lipopolysaccharide transport system permease protein